MPDQPELILDRQDRDEVVAAVESYLAEEITAFQLDDRLDKVRFGSKDPTARHIAKQLWYHYDDCKNHKVVLTRAQWDFVQRLLLLLKSDAHMRIVTHRIWSWRQLIAALALAGFIAIAVELGWGRHLFVYAVPFGPVSIALAWVRKDRLNSADQATYERLAPFESLPQVARLRRAVAGFRKRRYPPQLSGRTVRSPGMRWALDFQQYAVWIVFSPVALLFQSLPDHDGHVEILLPNTVS